MSARVLLLHVPYGELYARLNIRKLGWGVPPLGLASLSAYIRQKTDCKVKLVDMLFEGISVLDMPALLNEFNPDIVGLSASTPQMDNAYALSRMIKAHTPRVTVVIGGPHASALPQRTLEEEPSMDYAVIGEGEIPFLSLVELKPAASIKSLAWRKDNAVIINEREALIEDLGSLPFPDYESLPLRSYGTFYAGPSVGVMGGRGCHNRCSFCASCITHLGRYRFRPVEAFLDDIARLFKLGVARFDIWDDTFTFNKSRVYEFLEGLHARNLVARWTCETRVDCVDKTLLSRMRESGLDILHIGCESGNQEILDKANKKIKLEQVKQVCAWCRELGIGTYVYFILGLPFETKETAEQTIAFAKSLPIDFAQFSMLVPLPGTEVWNMAAEAKALRNLATSWGEYDRYSRAIVESGTLSAKELTECYRYALKSFYLRPAYILRCMKKIKNAEALKMYARLAASFCSLMSKQ